MAVVSVESNHTLGQINKETVSAPKNLKDNKITVFKRRKCHSEYY